MEGEEWVQGQWQIECHILHENVFFYIYFIFRVMPRCTLMSIQRYAAASCTHTVQGCDQKIVSSRPHTMTDPVL